MEELLTRQEFFIEAYGNLFLKGTPEYAALSNLSAREEIPFIKEGRTRKYRRSDIDVIKSKIQEIVGVEWLSILSVAYDNGVASSTFSSWCDQGLIPGYLKGKGIESCKILDVIQIIEILKNQKSNVLEKHCNTPSYFPCKICGKKFQVKPSHYESGAKITCSKECSKEYRKNDKLFVGSKSNKKMDIDDGLRQILEGELLGDGCLSRTKQCINAMFQYKTSNLQYSEYVKSLFNIFDPSNDYDHSQYTHLERATGYSWYTKTNPSLTEIYDRWYPDGIKIVPRDLELTPLVCLHWYIGDGCLETNHKTKQQYIELHTQGFNESNIDLLVQKLNDLGFIARKAKAKLNKLGHMTYKITISSKSMTKFLKYIGKCPVESYEYKWEILDPTYYLYEEYIYSTGNIAEMLGKPSSSIRKMVESEWFQKAGIDCIKMWSKLRFSEEGLQKLLKLMC